MAVTTLPQCTVNAIRSGLANNQAGSDVTNLLNRLGYTSNGTVTQASSATTAVTLNKISGQITTVVQNIAAAGNVAFTVNNSEVAAGDTVIVNLASGSTGGTSNAICNAVAAGSFNILIHNIHASTAETGTLVINFTVLKKSPL